MGTEEEWDKEVEKEVEAEEVRGVGIEGWGERKGVRVLHVGLD